MMPSGPKKKTGSSMGHKIRLNGLVEESVVDGPGLRFVVFMQGCPHHCKGCHNPETHDFAGGYLTDTEAIMARFMENPLLSGLTLSGGEPFSQPEAAGILAESVKSSAKHLIIYTGYLCEDLVRQAKHNEQIRRLLKLTDLLIDGPYDEALRDLNLDFRGSRNQRVLTQKDILEHIRQI